MKKLALGPSVTLVIALVVLFASLAALLLAYSLRGQLQETRGQLEEAQGQLQDARSELQKAQEAKNVTQKTDKGGAGPAGKQPNTVSKSQPQNNTKNQTQDPKSPGQAGQGEKEQ